MSITKIYTKVNQVSIQRKTICFIFTQIGIKLKLKTNIETKLRLLNTWHNYEVTCVVE